MNKLKQLLCFCLVIVFILSTGADVLWANSPLEEQKKDEPKFFGIAYEDALLLATEFNKNDNGSNGEAKKNYTLIYAILRHYLPDQTKGEWTLAEIIAEYKKIPFWEEDLKNQLDEKREDSKQQQKELRKTGPKGEVDEDKAGVSIPLLVDGMAKFLVERVKQELAIAFFDHFKKELEKPDYETLRKLFPQTHKTLKGIGDEIYNFNAYLLEIREAFEKDLSEMTTRLDVIVNAQEFKTFFTKNPKMKQIFEAAYPIVLGLANKKNPGEIIRDLDISNIKDGNLKSSMIILQNVSNSLRNKKQGDNYWINGDHLKKLFKKDNDSRIFRIYLGLLYQQSRNIEFNFGNGNKKIHELLVAETEKVITTIIPLFQKLLDKTEKIDQSLDDLTKLIKKKDKKPAIDDYYKVFSNVVVLLDYMVEVRNIAATELQHSIKLDDKNDHIKNFVHFVRTLGDIYFEIKQRNYGIAIVNFINLCDEYLFKDNKGKFKKTKEKLIKFGTFMTIVAKAETSEEVKEAIESFALPVGSYRIKRSKPFNIALNAYVGPAFGRDHIVGDKENSVNSISLTAPIGVTFSIGKLDCIAGSFSVFVSVVDIGAVTAYRFSDDGTSKLPEFEFKNIFSPGAFVVLGFKKAPISLGGGVQYGPQLRKIKKVEDNVEVTIDASSWRISVFIAVDIPLLNFYTSQ